MSPGDKGIGRARAPFAVGVLTALLALIAVPRAAWAADDLASLGPLTNATYTSLNLPLLGQFHRAGPVFHHGRLSEMVFLGTMADGGSAAERWAVVKALDQFGAWSGLTSATVTTTLSTGGLGVYPTYDWAHARFTSRYLAFDHKDYLKGPNRPYQRLGRAEQRLLGTYKGDQFLVVSIGGYVMGGSGFPYSDLSDNKGNSLTFQAVQTALQKSDLDQFRTMVTDINAETNVLVALICRADGKKPAKVCGAPTIATLLRHVR